MRYALAAPFLLAASALCSAASAQQVEFDLENTLTLGETEIRYRLDLVMTAVAPTRLAVRGSSRPAGFSAASARPARRGTGG